MDEFKNFFYIISPGEQVFGYEKYLLRIKMLLLLGKNMSYLNKNVIALKFIRQSSRKMYKMKGLNWKIILLARDVPWNLFFSFFFLNMHMIYEWASCAIELMERQTAEP